MLLTTRERLIVLCAGTLLGSLIAAFFMFTPPFVATAKASTLVNQQVNDSNSAYAVTNGGSLQNEQLYTTGFPTTFTQKKFGTSTEVVTAVYFLVQNDGGSTCTGTSTADSGLVRYCNASGATCTGGNRVYDTFDSCDNLNVPAGEQQWVGCYLSAPIGTPQLDRLVDLQAGSYTSLTNCSSTYGRFTTTNPLPDTQRQFDAGDSVGTRDASFVICSSGSCATVDPRPGTVTVYDPPDETELDYYQLAAGAYTFRATSDVSADTYPEYDGTDYWDFRIKNASEEVVWVALLRSTGRLYYDTEDYYAYAIAPSLSLPVGAYTVEARVEWFEDGEAVAISDWSTASDFTVSLGGELGGGAGGGGGASWGDDYGGGATDWDTFFASVDDHDTVYGACKLIGWSFTWDTGGSSESSAGDGLPCLWTWIQYALIPPADGFFNYLEYPLNVLLTRWPLAYVTMALQSVQDGLATSTACPLPTVGGSSIMGGATIPTIDPCEWFEDVATTVESSTAFVTLAVLGIYASLGLYAASRAREFLSS